MSAAKLVPNRRLALALAVFSVGFVAPVLLAQQPFPRPPVIPIIVPPASTFMPKPVMPNNNPPFNPAGGLNQREWVCEKCGHVLSRGAPAPIGTVCPGCGAVISGIDFSPNPIGPVNPGGINPPIGFAPPAGSTPPGGSMPPAGMNPAIPPVAMNPPIMPATAPAPINPAPPLNPPASSSASIPPSTASPSASVSPTPSSIGTVIVGVVIVLVGLAVLGGAACLILFNVVRNGAPAPRRRRRLVDYDD